MAWCLLFIQANQASIGHFAFTKKWHNKGVLHNLESWTPTTTKENKQTAFYDLVPSGPSNNCVLFSIFVLYFFYPFGVVDSIFVLISIQHVTTIGPWCISPFYFTHHFNMQNENPANISAACCAAREALEVLSNLRPGFSKMSFPTEFHWQSICFVLGISKGI